MTRNLSFLFFEHLVNGITFSEREFLKTCTSATIPLRSKRQKLEGKTDFRGSKIITFLTLKINF